MPDPTAALAALAAPSRLVAFVGAGASAVPPSSLPTWTGFNTLLLEALCERLAGFSRDRQPTAQILQAVKARRDGSPFLTPDFQAQLMEEEVGAAYFQVWGSLQTGTHGPVHEALARLAARGRLAAIVTTNFDRLLESALQAHGIGVEVFHDAAAFEALAAARPRDAASPLALLKIHGSLEDPASLVDTLRQRLVGRPPALQAVLDRLLREHTWLYLGFSGADFSHAPNYLNVLGSAPEARGFVFVNRPGQALQPGVQRLVEAYGAPRGQVVEGELPHWLHQAFGLPGATPPADPAAAAQATARVVDGVTAWVDTLGPVAVVNLVVALLKSSGDEASALWLLRKTWRSYRAPADTRGPSYARYLLNHGRALAAVGFLHNPVERAEDGSNLLDWKEAADEDATQYLHRSLRAAPSAVALAALAGALAWRGEVGRATALAREATGWAQAAGDPMAICDVTLECVVIYDVVQSFREAIERLREALGLATRLGDQPRQAQAAIALARFECYAGRTDEAAQSVALAQALVQRLGLELLRAPLAAVQGLLRAEQGQVDEAIARLQPLAGALQEADAQPLYWRRTLGGPDSPPRPVHGTTPLRIRVLLDLHRAALQGGQAGLAGEVLQALSALTPEPFLGHLPQALHAEAEGRLLHGPDPEDRARLAEIASVLDSLADTCGNPWARSAAQSLAGAVSPG